jgi:hypothetical protein
MRQKHHPYVSEEEEGRPIVEWIVAGLVVLATVFAMLGHMLVATLTISGTAVIIGLMRIVLKARSPWKVRSVGFDAFISIAFGLGLVLVYLSIQMMI